ncbi:Ctr copper transporter-like protein 2 [Elsinoe australis]|uniref:Copper transport protein n=1 Tax=Elsinoe australis TaxID=40998 RepID=A0A4U7AXM6_9PEZI|nr:Ctr copper transporter-like protein 2 [Elsinoe australis]
MERRHAGHSSDSMSMAMYFTTAQDTPLWSQTWTPSSTGAYAGTCIFLIVLAIVSRGLGAFRTRLERKWYDAAINRRYIVVAGGSNEGQLSRQLKEEGEGGVLTARGVDESVQIIKTKAKSREGTPFRLSTDLPRGAIYTVQAGVGYLLMLAVMTFNVGYFLSVLAGLFIGEVALGRFTTQHFGDH